MTTFLSASPPRIPEMEGRLRRRPARSARATDRRGARAYSNSDNPKEFLIVAEYEDVARAREMFQSQEFRDATKRAGVVGTPQVVFMDEALQLPA